MAIPAQSLFFFSALGAFNGLLAGLILLLSNRSKKLSSYLLGILILLVSIRIGKSSLYFFDQSISRDLLQLGLSANFLIGPVLLLYVKNTLRESRRLSSLDLSHMMGIVLLLALGLFLPYRDFPLFWDQYIRQEVNLQLTVYLAISTFYLWPVIKKLFSTTKLETKERWVLMIFMANLLVSLANVLALFTTYILGPLVFSVVFYTLLLYTFAFERKRQDKPMAKPRYQKKLSGDESNSLKTKLEHLIEAEKPYKNSELRLQDLALSLSTNPHTLSQLLNDNMDTSFSQFIKEHRVAEAKRLLTEADHITLEAIGYDAGFNSKSTFFTAFKKTCNMTPSQYRKQLLAEGTDTKK